jgi:hypothetical protein
MIRCKYEVIVEDSRKNTQVTKTGELTFKHRPMIGEEVYVENSYREIETIRHGLDGELYLVLKPYDLAE